MYLDLHNCLKEVGPEPLSFAQEAVILHTVEVQVELGVQGLGLRPKP